MRSQVLGGYRRLMRARATVFGGDNHAMEASRKQLRVEFDKNRAVTDPKKLASLVKGISEVEEMMTVNIVQAKLNDRGNFAVDIAPRHAQGLKGHGRLEPAGDAADKAEGKRPMVETSCASAGAAERRETG